MDRFGFEELIVACLECRLAGSLSEAAGLRADLAIVLCATRARMLGRRGGGSQTADDGARVKNADGSTTVKITSMGTLAQFLSGKM